MHDHLGRCFCTHHCTNVSQRASNCSSSSHRRTHLRKEGVQQHDRGCATALWTLCDSIIRLKSGRAKGIPSVSCRLVLVCPRSYDLMLMHTAPREKAIEHRTSIREMLHVGCLKGHMRTGNMTEKSTWSGFMPRHMEQPASRQSNPAALKISCSPSDSA